MKIVKNYIKYGLFILCGLIIGSVAHSVYANDSRVLEKEGEYQEALELVAESDRRMNQLEVHKAEDIAKIEAEYAPYIQEEAQINKSANTLLCNKEVELAKAKLESSFNGDLELSDEDSIRLSEKVLWKCGEVEVEAVTEIDTLLVEACTKHASNQETCPKIMKGVFAADSGICTKGAGASNLNCGNIRPGSGKYGDKDVHWTVYNNFRKYATMRDGVFDNVALYAQLYEGQSIDYMQKVWARAGDHWGNTVRQYANQ